MVCFNLKVYYGVGENRRCSWKVFFQGKILRDIRGVKLLLKWVFPENYLLRGARDCQGQALASV